MVKAELPPAALARHFVYARPRTPVLVSSRNPDGSLNVAPFNWNTPISADPPLFILALQERPQRSDTLGNLEASGQFVANFPGLDLARQIVTTSYEHRPGVSKFSASGLTPLASRVISVPGIAECRSHLECEVAEILRPAGSDHALVVARVVAASYDPAAWTETGEPQLDPVPPAVHLGQRRDAGGQTHIFLAPGGVSEVFVPYVERTDAQRKG